MNFRDLALREMGIKPVWVRRAPLQRDETPAVAPSVIPAVVPVVPAPLATPAERVPEPALVSASAAVAGAIDSVGAARRLETIRTLSHAALRDLVSTCGACGLCATRQRTVFGAGQLEVPWMLVGEGPGADDEAAGAPFTGSAGRLLDNMLNETGLARARDAYITHAVKCRTPDHGRPDAAAVMACRPHLWREITLVRPRLIVALGAIAAQSLLATDAPVGSLRGTVHRRDFDGHEALVVVTFHPAYLLRKPSEKARSWDDLCLARDTLGG